MRFFVKAAIIYLIFPTLSVFLFQFILCNRFPVARVGTASSQLLGKNAYEQVCVYFLPADFQSVIDQWIEFNTDFFQRTYAMWSFLDGWGTYVKEVLFFILFFLLCRNTKKPKLL